LSYVAPGSQQPILRNLNFALAPGEALGLIGPTAAGKTTLARLMVGALQPTRGHVRLGGADIAVWDSNDRGRHVGYLPQDIDLFQGTVRDNIARLGSGDDAAIVEAAMLAGVHEMVLGLPQGYDTRIGGPGGLRLSGGQRQRIGLARAVFGNPRFVVLDEPNSNLDAVGEQALLSALNALKARGATVVLIAHRPNMVANMDRILVLRAGAVDLFGPRDEVLARLARSAAAAQGEAATPLRPVSR
jgi:ABC-type protease/lipase transport system fused ATPase/permease subunit